MSVRVITGDCRDVLRTLPAESVHCVVTSPPYFGLRDYGTATWEGGDPTCEHSVGNQVQDSKAPGAIVSGVRPGVDASVCRRCGARRIDRQIGLEPTPDAYVAEMVVAFREVHRVLRKDGTVWLNLGDSYASGPTSPRERKNSTLAGSQSSQRAFHAAASAKRIPSDCKPKDLIGIPWMVAFALRADGWYLRQDIIWCLSGGAWLYARTPTKIGPMMLKDLTRLAPETVQLWNGERWTSVTAWTKRQGRADAIEIVLRSGERIGCTANHVWPTSRGNVRTDELEPGDVLRSTLLPDGERPQGWITDDAFWFAGLFLAEGSRSGETIQISGHTREAEERLRRLRALVSHYGGSARAYTAGNKHNIHIDSIGISAVLRSLIAGRTAKDKRIAPAAWHYPNWQLRQIVEGYLHGDGHVDGDRVRLGFCRNYDLERDLRCMAARLGATLTLKPTVARNQSGSFPSFKGEWRWARSGHHNERDRSEIIEIRNSRARQFWDVTVADDPHLFALASGVLTHNSKPNPMPESVRDRCTKAHEYIFLLSKSASYYYDADAIAEASCADDSRPQTRRARQLADASGLTEQHIAALKSCGVGDAGKAQVTQSGFGKNTIEVQALADEAKAALGGYSREFLIAETRNRRSVWTVATQPFSGARLMRGANGDSGRTVSPDCPLHGDQQSRVPTARHGERPTASLSDRNLDIGDGLLPVLSGVPAPTEKPLVVQTAPGSSDLLGQPYSPPAMPHSTRTRKTGLVPETSPRETGDALSALHIDGNELRSESDATFDHIPESNTVGDGEPDGTALGQAVQTYDGIVHKCTCEQNSTLTDHFAVFPPDLIEPCIKAGCPVGGTVLDPFGGAGTTGLVADRLQRNAILIELNPEYAAMAEKRVRGDCPMFSNLEAAE